MSENAQNGNSISEIIHFGIAIALMIFTRFIPPIDPITPYGMALIGVFLGVIWGWCFAGANTLPTSLLGIIFLGLTLPAGVLGATMQIFSSYVFIIVLFSLFTVGALLGANIAEYLVVKMLSIETFKKNPWVLILFIFIGSYWLSFVTNPMVVGIFMMSLCETLLVQVGYKPGDKTAVMILLGIALVVLLESITRPWTTPPILGLSALTTATGIEVAYGPYMIWIIVASMITLVLFTLFMKILGCDVKPMLNADLTFLQEKYKDGMSAHQKAVLTCILLLAVGSLLIVFFPKGTPISGLITGKLTIIGWMPLIVAFMLFIKVDGKPILSKQTMASFFPWDLLLMISTGVLIGTLVVGEGTGVGPWLGGKLGPILSGMSDITFYLAVAAIGLFLTNVLNNNAVMILMTSTIISLYSYGLVSNPTIAILIAIAATDFGFVTPASSMYGALLHGNAMTTPGSMYKYGLLTALFCFATLAVVFIPIAGFLF